MHVSTSLLSEGTELQNAEAIASLRVSLPLCFMSNVLRTGRLHPAVLQEHAHSLPTAPADSQALTTEEFHRWLTNIYTRFNPSLLPKATWLNLRKQLRDVVRVRPVA